jgi:hypothetical protein
MYVHIQICTYLTATRKYISIEMEWSDHASECFFTTLLRNLTSRNLCSSSHHGSLYFKLEPNLWTHGKFKYLRYNHTFYSGSQVVYMYRKSFTCQSRKWNGFTICTHLRHFLASEISLPSAVSILPLFIACHVCMYVLLVEFITEGWVNKFVLNWSESERSSRKNTDFKF